MAKPKAQPPVNSAIRHPADPAAALAAARAGRRVNIVDLAAMCKHYGLRILPGADHGRGGVLEVEGLDDAAQPA